MSRLISPFVCLANLALQNTQVFMSNLTRAETQAFLCLLRWAEAEGVELLEVMNLDVATCRDSPPILPSPST